MRRADWRSVRLTRGTTASMYPADTIPASQPACVLVKDQAPMNCGRSAGIMEYPVRLRISAPHTAATIAGEGPVRAELAEVTVYRFRLIRVDRSSSSCSRIMGVGAVGQRYDRRRGYTRDSAGALLLICARAECRASRADGWVANSRKRRKPAGTRAINEYEGLPHINELRSPLPPAHTGRQPAALSVGASR